VNVYQVLRRLIQLAGGMGETERADALAAIDQAEQWSVFGTVAGQLSVNAHKCEPTYPNGQGQPPVCGLCKRLMEV